MRIFFAHFVDISLDLSCYILVNRNEITKMPRAECYYKILGIEETASSDEVKKAYRNLALVWHPDKNQANPEEAHAKFQTILKAYETLSDNRERDWYDRHKDQILSDGDKSEETTCLNLFQYFSSSCYANFDDSEDGFYTIYRGVFEKIVEEETHAYRLANKSTNSGKNKKFDNDPSNYPKFGDSKSDYEEVVREFYAFWSGFCTHLTFDNLDKYNTTEAENRRILRAMEKENKKVKEAARKERNTNVRNLVEFIKKRDRRLKAHKLLVEQQNELNRQKTAEKQRQQREKTLKESSEYKPTVWEDMNDIEAQLQQLESEYDDDRGSRKRNRNRKIDLDDDDEPIVGVVDQSEPKEPVDDVSNKDDDEEETAFFCPACNKDFRSIKAFENHEASKKHKQNVLKLTKLLKEEEKSLDK